MSRYQEALLGQVVAQLKRDENDALRCDTHEIFYVSDRGCPGCAERERIIKLLEETLGFDFDIGIFDLESNCQIDLEMLIELIKGENK
jgi:hypothetical protein